MKNCNMKKIKTIESQGENQVKATKGYGKQLAKSNKFIEKDNLPPTKQKQLFYNFIVE